MHALLINDTSKTANIGGRANTVSLKMMLKSAGVKEISSIYGYNIDSYISDINYKSLIKYYLLLCIPPILSKIKNKIWGNAYKKPKHKFEIPLKWIEFDALANRYLKARKYHGIIELIRSVDIVIVNGEGTIYGDREESLFILFLTYLAKKYLSKPTIIVNHTLDAGEGELYKVVVNLYPLVDDIVFREYTSLKNFCYFSKARFAADTAFAYKAAPKEALQKVITRSGYYNVWPHKTYNFNPDNPYIAISGSSIFFRKDMKCIDPSSDFIDLCLDLKKEFNQIICISSDVPDERLLKEVTDSLKLPFISYYTPPLQILDIIGNARVFISGRWHASIFALSSGVPVVAFSAHNFKMRALLDLVNINDEVYNADNLSRYRSDIIKKVRAYYNNDKIRQDLLKKAITLRKSAYENVNFIKNLKPLK